MEDFNAKAAAQRRLKITTCHVNPEHCSMETNKDGLSAEECAARVMIDVVRY